MHVAIIYTPTMPLPPMIYGGVEQIISELIRGLIEREIHVTLFAPEGTDFSYFSNGAKNLYARNIEIVNVPQGWDDEEVFDIFKRWHSSAPTTVVHDHSASKMISKEKYPVKHIVTCHGDTNKQYAIIGDYIVFNSLSDMLYHASRAPKESKLYNITSSYGDIARQYYNNNPSDYLLYLGRIELDKGVSDAIEIARLSNHRLIIAGNIGNNQEYFDDEIQTNLEPGKIEYIGEVGFNSSVKFELIANAKALLFPSHYHESGAGVVKEAAMCGTPVIAYPNGANVDDIVQGRTGYLCNTVEQMANAVNYIDRINRRDCLKYSWKFARERMIDSYYKLYCEILGE